MRSTTLTAPPLDRVLPAEQILTGAAAREWAKGVAADVVVFPQSVAEVQAVVRTARESGTRLLPAGRGNWLAAGGWARAAGVVVSMSRLDVVHHYEPADLTLTADAGIGLDRLAKIVGPNGQWLPVDAPGSHDGTLGAAVACGMSGPLRSRYGATRDNVLGIEVVTGDGRVLRIGGRVVKNVAGYDLVRLFTGSRGSLGIVTRVSVRLFPRPDADATLLFAGNTSEVVAAARCACTSEVPAAAVELLEGKELGVDRAMVASVRLQGGRDEVEESRRRLVAALGAEPWATWRNGESRRFHAARVAWEDRAPIVARLAALPALLGPALDAARAIADDLRGTVTADAVQGLVRVKGAAGSTDHGAVAESLSRARSVIEELGGTLTLGQAPTPLAARVGWTGAMTHEAVLTKRIKALFDPDSVLAPRCP